MRFQSIVASDAVGFLDIRDPVLVAPSVGLQGRHCPLFTLTRARQRLSWTPCLHQCDHVAPDLGHFCVSRLASRRHHLQCLLRFQKLWEHGLGHNHYTKMLGSDLTWMARLMLWPQTLWNWTRHRLLLLRQRRPLQRPRTTVQATRSWCRQQTGIRCHRCHGQRCLSRFPEIFQATRIRLTTSTGPPPLRQLQHHQSPWQRQPR